MTAVHPSVPCPHCAKLFQRRGLAFHAKQCKGNQVAAPAATVPAAKVAPSAPPKAAPSAPVMSRYPVGSRAHREWLARQVKP